MSLGRLHKGPQKLRLLLVVTHHSLRVPLHPDQKTVGVGCFRRLHNPFRRAGDNA